MGSHGEFVHGYQGRRHNRQERGSTPGGQRGFYIAEKGIRCRGSVDLHAGQHTARGLISLYSRAEMAYPLPAFVSRVVTAQPSPPRQVPLFSVVRAVLSGFDCAIYAGGAVVAIAFGVAAVANLLPSGSARGGGPAGGVILGLGLPALVLPGYRLSPVHGGPKNGDAQPADAAEGGEGEVGGGLFYGTPWGEAMGTRMNPIAATGAYRLPTGEMGRYYLQQWWATRLTPGARIWVLRRKDRVVLFAPV